jgi:carbonic anhydrase/acetyltransferase-like protein (isoleucine patch superfamily)
MIRSFDGHTPAVPASAFVDDTAVVIGDVVLAEEVSVWPLAVIRGDVNAIRIGARSNIQDGSVVHCSHAGPFNPEGGATVVGEDVTVGHRVILHACTIEDRVLVGMGSIVMDDVVVKSDVVIGAGALVPPGKVLESGYLYVGSPVKQLRPLTDKEKEYLTYSANYYAKLKNRHRGG